MESELAALDTAAAPEDSAQVNLQQGGKGMLPTAGRSIAGSGGKGAGARGVPYIVSVDVSRAFDNVDANLLLSIAEPLMRSPEYLIIKYTEVCLLLLAHLLSYILFLVFCRVT